MSDSQCSVSWSRYWQSICDRCFCLRLCRLASAACSLYPHHHAGSKSKLLCEWLISGLVIHMLMMDPCSHCLLPCIWRWSLNSSCAKNNKWGFLYQENPVSYCMKGECERRSSLFSWDFVTQPQLLNIKGIATQATLKELHLPQCSHYILCI